MRLIVQKYGGSSVATLEQMKNIAKHISQCVQRGQKIVAVVSAMGDQTDELLEMAHQLSERPNLREVDMLLTAGERISMSLLSIALHDVGVKSISLTGSQSGILTDNNHGNAKITEILGQRIREGIEKSSVVIIAGFQGVNPKSKEVTTLGRGGSDLSAIALAEVLGAEACHLYKDTGFILSADPRVVPFAKPIHKISWSSICELAWSGAGVLHHRGADLAKKHNIRIEVRSNVRMDEVGTVIEGDQNMENPTVEAITSISDISLVKVEFDKTEKPNLYSEILKKLWEHGESPVYNNLQFDAKSQKVVVQMLLKSKLKGFFQDVLSQIGNHKLQFQDQLAVISAVGQGFKQNPEFVEKAFLALKTMPVVVEVKTNNILICVEQQSLSENIQNLHRTLIGE